MTAGKRSISEAVGPVGDWRECLSGLQDDAEVARLRRWLLSKLLRVSIGHANAHVILQNNDDLEELRSRGILPRCTTHLIRGSGVDLEGFRPHPEVSGTPRVLLPARLLIDKGIREFCASDAHLVALDYDTGR